MRVIWIQDYIKREGGAEQSNKAVVHVGESLGFDIVGMSPMHFPEQLLKDADVAVINNFHAFSHNQAGAIRRSCLHGPLPFVMYSHDYRDLRRTNFIGAFFEKSRLNVFISPKHMEDYRGTMKLERCVSIPLCVDPKGFQPVQGIERRRNSAVIVAPQKQGAQCAKFIAEHKEWVFCSLGQRLLGCEEVRASLPFKDMPKIYSEFENLVHFPRSSCGGERVLFEAALCGCLPWSNGNAGHASWGYDWKDREKLSKILEEAPFTFWKALEENCT